MEIKHEVKLNNGDSLFVDNLLITKSKHAGTLAILLPDNLKAEVGESGHILILEKEA
jgi:hypothetical protein